MKGRAAISLAVGLFLAGVVASHTRAEDDGDLPLPKWPPQELEEMRANPNLPPILGGLLGGIEEMGDVPAPTPLLLGDETASLVDSPEKSQPSMDLSRFLPPSLLAGPQSHPPQIHAKVLQEVRPQFLATCEKPVNGSHLIDPNHELSEQTVEDLERFLTFHATDSQIPLTLVILGKNQKLPDNANVAAFGGGHLCEGSSAILVCSFGEPWRSRLFISETIRNGVSADTLNDLLENGIQEAMRATDPVEQLHRMLVRLSIRLFWVQRQLTPVARGTSPSQVTVFQGTPPAMAEIKSSGESPSMTAKRRISLTHAAMILILFSTAYGYWRWRRFKMRHYEWIIPPRAVPCEPRFGGTSCGAGTAIHFR